VPEVDREALGTVGTKGGPFVVDWARRFVLKTDWGCYVVWPPSNSHAFA
jgi:hypothetical protein